MGLVILLYSQLLVMIVKMNHRILVGPGVIAETKRMPQ